MRGRVWVCELVASCGGIAVDSRTKVGLVRVVELLFSRECAPKHARMYIRVMCGGSAAISISEINGGNAGISCQVNIDFNILV